MCMGLRNELESLPMKKQKLLRHFERIETNKMRRNDQQSRDYEAFSAVPAVPPRQPPPPAWFRLRGSRLKRKRGRFYAVWVEMRPLFHGRKIVPLSEAIELADKLSFIRRRVASD